MKESNITKLFMLECSRLGGIPERCNAGMARAFNSENIIKLHSKGFPDYIAILPKGITVYVELKATGKKLRPDQVKWRDLLLSLGHHYLKYDKAKDLENYMVVHGLYGLDNF